jgi:hypothetical protein
MANHSAKPENLVGETSPRDRRQWPRYPLRDAHGTLSWQKDGQDFQCGVTIDNISGGGVAVLVDQPLDGVPSVSLRLDSAAPNMEPWVSDVVGASRQEDGRYFLRLRFTRWIPLDTVLEKHRERRMWQRYPANEIEMTLTWEERGKEVTVVGRLANLSGGGAALITTVHPPFNRGMWLELLDRSHMIEPVEARLVVFSDDPSGLKIARLWFVGACPLELFQLCREAGDSASQTPRPTAKA